MLINVALKIFEEIYRYSGDFLEYFMISVWKYHTEVRPLESLLKNMVSESSKRKGPVF